MKISLNTLFNFYMYFFLAAGLIFIAYAFIKSYQIKLFRKKRMNNYYREITAYFSYFEEEKYKKGFFSRYPRTLSHVIFTYEINGEEYIYRGKHSVNKYSKKNSYQKEERITLYQDPNTGTIFESLCTSEPEVKRFAINGVILLGFAFFIFFIKYVA